MPLYEYQCADCGEEFEKIVPFTQADQKPKCPFCGNQDTSKKISKTAFFGSSELGSSSSTASSCGSSGRFT